MSKKASICVFCGSREGNNPIYKEAALEVASQIVTGGYSLVYGGGSIGLMGVVANHCLENQTPVIGIIPEYINDLEVGHTGVTEMVIVESMYERKQVMEERSDAFIILPGGFGTFDELFEFLALAQLKQHAKPILIYNFNGFFDPILAQIQIAVDEGFIHPKYQELVLEAKNITELFEQIHSL